MSVLVRNLIQSARNLYLSKELAGQLWNNTLSGGMRSIEGDSANLEAFFEVNKLTIILILFGKKSSLTL